MSYKNFLLSNGIFLIILILVSVYGYYTRTIYFFSFILIHECAHYLVLKYYKIDVKKIELYPFGGKLSYNYKYMEPYMEIYISLAGPLINVFLGIILYLLNVDIFYIYANLFLAFINLIPALPLDGGRILRVILINYIPYEKATKILCYIAYLLSFIMFFCSFNRNLVFKGNISIDIFAAFVLMAAYKENKTAIYMFMRDIAYKKEIMQKKKVMNCRSIIALKNATIKEIYKKFLYGKYHIVYVMNKDLTNFTSVTETQIFNAALKYGLNCTLHDVVEFYGSEKNEK